MHTSCYLQALTTRSPHCFWNTQACSCLSTWALAAPSPWNSCLPLLYLLQILTQRSACLKCSLITMGKVIPVLLLPDCLPCLSFWLTTMFHLDKCWYFFTLCSSYLFSVNCMIDFFMAQSQCLQSQCLKALQMWME